MRPASAAPAVVSLHVWRLRRRDVAAALPRVVTLRQALDATEGLAFVRVLGTASATFTPRDATPTRWAVVAAWRDDGGPARVAAAAGWWSRRAVETATLRLRPVWSRGRWGGVAPFGARADAADTADAADPAGPVVSLTRSRLRPGRALAFYRAVPAIARELATAPGLRAAFAVGEAPLLLQGTVSVWDDVAHMRAFAHRAPAHRAAVRATAVVGWYAEELFAHFGVVDATGSIDGRPVGG